MHTSLLLYGKGVPDYGERIAENLVNVLENFAGPVDPINPTHGQVWYDTGATFEVLGADEVANEITVLGDASLPHFAAGQIFKTVSLVDDGTNDNWTIGTWTSLGFTYNGTTTIISTNENIVSIFPSGTRVITDQPQDRLKVFYDPAFTGRTTEDGGAGEWISANLVYTEDPATAGGSYVAGDLWFDESDPLRPVLRVYDGSTWTDPQDRYLSKLDGGVMSPATYISVNEPIAASHTTTKNYVDLAVDEKVDTNGTTQTLTGDFIFSDNVTMDSELDLGDNYINNLLAPSFVWTPGGTVLPIANQVIAPNIQYVHDAVQYALDNSTGSGGTGNSVLRSGDEMTGDLSFNAQPSGTGDSPGLEWYGSALGDKLFSIYADNQVSGLTSKLVFRAGSGASSSNEFAFMHPGSSDPNELVLRVSGTLVDSAVPIRLPFDPTSALEAATKQYVDTEIAANIGGGGTSDGVIDTLTYLDSLNVMQATTSTGGVITSNPLIGLTTTSLLVTHTVAPVTDQDQLLVNNEILIGYGININLDYAITLLDHHKAKIHDPVFSGMSSNYNEIEVSSFVTDAITVNNTDFPNIFRDARRGATLRMENGLGGYVNHEIESATSAGNFTTINVVGGTGEPDSNPDRIFFLGVQAEEPSDYATSGHVAWATNVDRFYEAAAGSAGVITPDFVVGSDTLMVFHDGLKRIKGIHYNEDGVNGDVMNSITFTGGNIPAASDDMEYIVISRSLPTYRY
jgi:hypothetical protein